MKHYVTGYPLDSDELIYKQNISAGLQDLKTIMEWSPNDECVHVYKLSSGQLEAIEAFCDMAFPKELELYLTCSA